MEKDFDIIPKISKISKFNQLEVIKQTNNINSPVKDIDNVNLIQVNGYSPSFREALIKENINDEDKTTHVINNIQSFEIPNLELIGFKNLNKLFALTPITKTQYLQCNILISDNKFSVYTNKEEKFILNALKTSKKMSSKYLISVEFEDFKSKSNIVGCLRSNLLGTKYNIYDNGKSPEGKEICENRCHLGLIEYKQNLLRFDRPRIMNVYIPDINPLTSKPYVIKPESKKYNMALDRDEGEVKKMINKPPEWNDKLNAFVYTYDSRVTIDSIKNFILIDADGKSANKHILQLGKLNERTFSMDFTFPLTPLQAFAICLSSIENKIGCD